ncbi:LysR family transcriptional regulator [Sporomusa acidovorans]|uniref:HTH-type transcriptional regulator HdfR n=1 Tax=Sporomusa acidovorans (strain ATCC 49682 / DSM 3132 / Mol) TaxID=1123286 RepID=A0ABZ3IZ51_SPOA4|nr:LysR family transcriptional regulator [Sporomusa acidovorans]OZC16849.1 HTH-type transcriptional regulator CysL [Sporomusa acidovorans DSM 3132]SDF24335.1 DNA-binding transcriptional regulator, LysR family [Sporomusa acidovorans]
MTIRHLKIFIAVAETGKMSAAAAKYFISQPTVSQAIRELETHYGVLLFERISKKLYITEAGKNLLTYARVAVKQFDELNTYMLIEGHAEKIRVGVTVTVGSCMLPSMLNRFQERMPQVEPFAYMNNTKSIEDKILQAELDIGIVEGQVKSHDLVNSPAVKDYLVIVCANTHRLAGRKRISVKELENERFVMREEGSGTRELFENYMQNNGVKLKIGWEITCPGVIKNVVLENDCLAAISIRLVTEEIKAGRMYVIKSRENAWDRSFNIVYYKNKYITESMKAIMEIAREYDNADFLKGIPTGILVNE